MDMPLWFSNLLFGSVQVAFFVLAAAFLARMRKLQQPRVLLLYWRTLLVVSLLLPLVQPWHRPPTIAATVIPADFAVPASLSADVKPGEMPPSNIFRRMASAKDTS